MHCHLEKLMKCGPGGPPVRRPDARRFSRRTKSAPKMIASFLGRNLNEPCRDRQMSCWSPARGCWDGGRESGREDKIRDPRPSQRLPLPLFATVRSASEGRLRFLCARRRLRYFTVFFYFCFALVAGKQGAGGRAKRLPAGGQSAICQVASEVLPRAATTQGTDMRNAICFAADMKTNRLLF